MSAETILKDPSDRIDGGFDWEDWLNGDTITASAWTVPTGLTNYSDSFTTTTTTLWLTGGTAQTEYVVTNQITTNGGRIKQRSIKILVAEQ